MESSCIVLFCGLPGVGKSTFAAKLVERLLMTTDKLVRGREKGKEEEKAAYHIIYICFDDIIPMNLYEISEKNERDIQFSFSLNEDRAWKKFRNCIMQFVDNILAKHHNSSRSIHNDEDGKCIYSNEIEFVKERVTAKNYCSCVESLDADEFPVSRCNCRLNHVILLDDNMFYRSMRYKYFQLARTSATGFLQIHVSCDRDILLKQNSTRANPIKTETINHMETAFEIPDPQENEWESHVINYQSDKDNAGAKIHDAFEMINHCLKNPVPQLEEEDLFAKEKATEINLKSILHQADQVLRKHIAAQIKELHDLKIQKDSIREKASKLNRRKKSFFEILKRSRDTLKQLDILLSRFHDSSFNDDAIKSNGFASYQNRQIGMLVPDCEKTPQELSHFSHKKDFDLVVVNLFNRFNEDRTISTFNSLNT